MRLMSSIAPRLQIVRRSLVWWLDSSIQTSYAGSGTSWADISGGGNNSSLVNGVGYSSDNGGVLTFDGTNDYATVPSGVARLSGSYTVSVWVRWSALPTSGTDTWILAEWSGFNRNYLLLISQSGKLNLLNGNGAGSQDSTLESSTSLSINTWYMVTARRDGTNTFIFINGAQDATMSNTHSGGTTTVDRYLFIDPSFLAKYFQGRCGMVLQYNRALSDDEISHNYNVTKHLFL